MPQDVEYLKDAIKAAEAKLPDGHRAIVISVPCDEPNPQIRYIAGIGREDAVSALKTLLFRWGKNEEWMEHVE